MWSSKIKIIDGKVYAVANDNISDKIYDILKKHDEVLLKGFTKNSEVCHITIVNSNIVYDIGINEIEKLLNDFGDSFTIKTGEVKSTFSKDWTIFSYCYVCDIYCDYIDNFLKKFNEKFNKQIKPSKHITFAIKPRSLFINNY